MAEAKRMETRAMGPFHRGVIDRANASAPGLLTGAVRRLSAGVYSGAARLAVRAGSAVAMTHLDDQDTPALVTSVCLLEQFSDWALSVAHSTITNKAYLYRLQADMSGWWDASGDLHSDQMAEPVGVLWSTITIPPDVRLTEELGAAYIAHTAAADGSALRFASKKYVVPATITTMTSDLDGNSSAEDLYFLGIIAFQQHLWGWGVGAGTSAANHFRPELLRFSQPFTDTFVTADSITVGDRVRSQREKVVGAAVAGEALFIGSPFALTRVTGYGRNSWFKKPLDKTYGFPGPKCFAVRGDTLYYWSNRGPVRCQDGGEPEHLWPSVDKTVLSVLAPETITAGYDEDRDIVMFAYDKGNGVRTWAGYDAPRQAWVGPDDDLGLKIRYISTVTPIFGSAGDASVRPPPGDGAGPVGPPTDPTTSGVGPTTAIANWVAGDIIAQTQVEIKRVVDSTWTIAGLAPGNVPGFVFVGLVSGQDYEWRVAHLRSEIYSAYLGPSAPTRFTTAGALLPPQSAPILAPLNTAVDLQVRWVNSGELGIQTDVELAGPSDTEPADGDFILEAQIFAPLASIVMRIPSTGLWWVRIRHSRLGFTSSSYTGPVSVAIDRTEFT